MSKFVHGDNILQKENHQTKYIDALSKKYLSEIREKYEIWHNWNMQLEGPFRRSESNDRDIIEKRVVLFNEYKDFLDQQHYAEKFDSRSNLYFEKTKEYR